MTNFLITVGTGSFDSLVSVFDNSDIDCFIQYGVGDKPISKPSIDFHHDFLSLISDFDYIITHCGAGTVFPLLKLNAKLIVIPNMERNDPHQVELFNFLMQNNFCIGLQLEYLKSVINSFTLFINELDKTIDIQPYVQPKFDLEKFKKLLFSC